MKSLVARMVILAAGLTAGTVTTWGCSGWPVGTSLKEKAAGAHLDAQERARMVVLEKGETSLSFALNSLYLTCGLWLVAGGSVLALQRSHGQGEDETTCP